MLADGRTFLALLPPSEHDAELRHALALASKRLTRHLPQVRWVQPSQLHLTIKFYGNLSGEKRELLAARLTELAARHAAPTGELAGLDAFPSLRKPRAIYVGLMPLAAYAPVAEVVDAFSGEVGVAREERALRPHVTLGRVNKPRTLDNFQRAVEEISNEVRGAGGTQPWRRLALFDSRLTGTGPIYSIIADWDLPA